jgi:four helix bundle protein
MDGWAVPDHERFPVYRKALDLHELVLSWIPTLDRRDTWTADQLRRASASIVVNIAEGAGEFSPREKARFYRMALRSATEASAILDLVRLSSPHDTKGAAARDLVIDIVPMLKRLSVAAARRRLAKRPRNEPEPPEKPEA